MRVVASVNCVMIEVEKMVKGKMFLKKFLKGTIMTALAVVLLLSVPGELGKQTGMVMEVRAAQGPSNGTVYLLDYTKDIELTRMGTQELYFKPSQNSQTSFRGAGITVNEWTGPNSMADVSNYAGIGEVSDADTTWWYSYDATDKILNLYGVENECTTDVYAGETYTMPQFITLDGGCSRIYYTTNGSNPTTASAYVKPGQDISISRSCDLKMMPALVNGTDIATGNVTTIHYTLNVSQDVPNINRVLYPADCKADIGLTRIDEYGMKFAGKDGSLKKDGVTFRSCSVYGESDRSHYSADTQYSDSVITCWYSYDADDKILTLYSVNNECYVALDETQTYTKPQIVEVDGECHRIYYTKDGSNPTTASAYVIPGKSITLDSTCSLKMMPAIVVEEKIITGTVTTINYKFNMDESIPRKERVIYQIDYTKDIALTWIDEYGIQLSSKENSFESDGVTVKAWAGDDEPTEKSQYVAVLDASSPQYNCWYSYDANSKILNMYSVRNGIDVEPNTAAHYTTPQEVKLSGRFDRVYYTTDGSNPTTASTYIVKGENILLSQSCDLKMLPAVVNGEEIATGTVSSVRYTIGEPLDDDEDDKDEEDKDEDDKDEDNKDEDDKEEEDSGKDNPGEEDKGDPVPGSGEKEWVFTDVPQIPGWWKYESIKYVYNHDIMYGISATLFAPDMQLDRAMFASVLYRMAGSPQINFENIFPDVQDGKYYSQAVIWANQQKIAVGYPDGTFGINENITREQIARMLYEYARNQGYDVIGRASLDNFADKDSVSSWAADNVKWAVSAGILNGKVKGDTLYLDPGGEATRAECATMLTMFLKKYAPDK